MVRPLHKGDRAHDVLSLCPGWHGTVSHPVCHSRCPEETGETIRQVPFRKTRPSPMNRVLKRVGMPQPSHWQQTSLTTGPNGDYLQEESEFVIL